MSAHIPHALTLLRMGRHKEAEAALRQCLSGDMENALALQLLARALTGQNKHKQAEEAARKAVALEPEDESAHFVLARTLTEADRLNEALKEAEAAVRLSPEDANHQRITRRAAFNCSTVRITTPRGGTFWRRCA